MTFPPPDARITLGDGFGRAGIEARLCGKRIGGSGGRNHPGPWVRAEEGRLAAQVEGVGERWQRAGRVVRRAYAAEAGPLLCLSCPVEVSHPQERGLRGG